MASTHSNHHLESAPGKRTFAGDLLGAICLVASHLKQLEKSNIVALEYGRLIAHETKLGKDYNRRIWKQGQKYWHQNSRALSSKGELQQSRRFNHRQQLKLYLTSNNRNTSSIHHKNIYISPDDLANNIAMISYNRVIVQHLASPIEFIFSLQLLKSTVFTP